MSAVARPVNKPRVVKPGARPDSLPAHMASLTRKMYQTAVESDGKIFFVGMTQNEKTGEPQWSVYASNQWREALCNCSELWQKLEMLAGVEDAAVDDEQVYAGDSGAGMVKSITARTDDKQKQKDWPHVDSFWQGSATPIQHKRVVDDGVAVSPAKRVMPVAPRRVVPVHPGWGDDERSPFDVLLASAALPY